MLTPTEALNEQTYCIKCFLSGSPSDLVVHGVVLIRCSCHALWHQFLNVANVMFVIYSAFVRINGSGWLRAVEGCLLVRMVEGAL